MAHIETGWMYQKPKPEPPVVEERFVVVTVSPGIQPENDQLVVLGPFGSEKDAQVYGETLKKLFWVKPVVTPFYERLGEK